MSYHHIASLTTTIHICHSAAADVDIGLTRNLSSGTAATLTSAKHIDHRATADVDMSVAVHYTFFTTAIHIINNRSTTYVDMSCIRNIIICIIALCGSDTQTCTKYVTCATWGNKGASNRATANADIG